MDPNKKMFKKEKACVPNAISDIDSAVTDFKFDLRNQERDAMQVKSDLERINFKVCIQNNLTVKTVLDSIMDLRSRMDKFVKENEA